MTISRENRVTRLSAGPEGSGTTAGVAVTFSSHGETLAGRLYRPGFGAGPAPAVAILGPMTFQKEQAPAEYARRLADLGCAALTFDVRYRGESSGEPRCFESPAAKIKDLHAAVDWLGARPEVDAGRIAVLGICMGASHVLPVAADNPRVGAVATVSGQYRDHAADVAWLGSENAVAARLARGQEAERKYRETGNTEYVPAVDYDRIDAGMPGRLVWSWYQLQADRGVWENRYAVMSDAAMFSFESISAAARLAKPWLMIHSDQCAVPDAAHRHYAVSAAPAKRLLWQGQTRHLQYYDDPAVIDQAVWEIADWFASHLPPAR